jgi:transglutaminase-like putative cysteine protease
MAAIHREFAYDGTATSVTTAEDAFEQKRGVCQDFAHVMIVAARAHGIPAAYVSGYLRTLPLPGQPRLVGADAMHAWAALWCGEEIGWVGFDLTNDVLAGTDHILSRWAAIIPTLPPSTAFSWAARGKGWRYRSMSNRWKIDPPA